MAMSTLPSALKGNLPARTEPIRHRAPKFGTHLKPTRNVQLKPLQVERRFSHYEQKIANAPIDRCNTKIPRRLQTRKLSRPIKPMYDDERVKWNERLAAWLKEDQTSTVEYIKFTDQFNIIEKHLYYCSACHEFFHLNLKDRESRKGCPRHRRRHGDFVRPVSVHKVKKPRRKQPTVISKDPFGDRSNLKIPSLFPPKPARKVLVDVPPLPPIPKVAPRKSVVPPAPSQASTQRIYPSPVSTTPAFTPIVVNDDPLPSPTKFENISEKPQSPAKPVNMLVPPEEKPKQPKKESKIEPAKEVVTIPQPSPVPTEESSESPVSPPPQIIQHHDNEEEGRNSEEIDVVSFNRHELNDIYECSDVESMQQEAAIDPEDNCGKSTNSEDDDSDDILELVDDPDVEVELQIQSAELPEESPSPARNRPKPPPPDLPNLSFDESPDFIPVKKKPPLKKRKAMILPPIEQDKPKPKTPKPEKPKINRMTSEELARRMRKAKEIDGYRQKYAFGYDTGQTSATESDCDDDSGNFDVYENSFLEKYCLVSSKQLKACKRMFKQFDHDEDGLLKTEEVVNAMHKMFSPKVIEDASMCYIFRILETTSFDMFSERMNLKLFAIVVSLAQRISELDKYQDELLVVCAIKAIVNIDFNNINRKQDANHWNLPIADFDPQLFARGSYMKHLIGRVNTEVVDWKIHEARSLFEYTMKRDANGAYKVPMESLWIELHAGGISKENERQVRKYGSNSRSVHQNLSFNERVDKYQPNPVILPPVSGSTNDFQTHGWLTGQTGRH